MQKIRVAGIVAEYNPFHKGHAWMIEQLRGQGCETVVCVMSGAFVQRAEPALFPPQLRAKAALEAGADLVLRLPLPWAVASAERFAEGGAGLLAALGCVDTLAFGAETADVEALEMAACVLEGPAFMQGLKAELAKGVSFAAARAAAAERVHPGLGALLGSPNNILAVEYCKALQGAAAVEFAGLLARRESPAAETLARHQMEALKRRAQRQNQAAADGMVAASLGFITGAGAEPILYPRPHAIARQGVAHDADDAAGGFASASMLRNSLRKGRSLELLRPFVPDACMPLYRHAVQTGGMVDYDKWDFAAMARLRGVEAETLARRTAAGEGLEARLAAAVKEETSLSAVFDAAKTKRFAHSRVRRLALEQVLDLPKELPAIPPFAQVLAANSNGLGLMRRINKRAVVPVSTSLAKLRKESGEIARLIALETAAEDLYDLCLRTPRAGGASFTQAAAITKNERKR